MRRTVWALAAALVLAAASGLAGEDPKFGPPPLRDEAPTLQPSPNHVWIEGYWKWGGINYEWVEGRWVKGKKGKVWTPGTWEQVGVRWVWKPGKWTKPEAEKKAASKGKKGKPKKEPR
ncbi:MAG TPA: hypothetical protein ENO03_01745 [Candidatus Aminicenantes bacterium]|nr:YXWGXW repeat-containing protein [Candidatus Aminicenantes bacterium]HDT13057.1 hypothetical protein [Candidatus Aminicenantes bacterium]